MTAIGPCLCSSVVRRVPIPATGTIGATVIPASSERRSSTPEQHSLMACATISWWNAERSCQLFSLTTLKVQVNSAKSLSGMPQPSSAPVPGMSWNASSPNSQPLATAAVEARPGSRPSALPKANSSCLDRDRKTGAPRTFLAKSERGQFIYAGPAFIALRSAAREEFRARLAELKQERPVLSWLRNRDAHWVRPQLTLKVKHLASARLLRHATVREMKR